MEQYDNYVQAKFNYGLKTQESIFNDSEEIARLMLAKEYVDAYDFLEVFINKLSAQMKPEEFKTIKKKMKELQPTYLAYKKFQFELKHTKSRFAKIAIKKGMNPKVPSELREGLLEIDYMVRMFLKKRGISTPKEIDETKVIVEGKR